MKNQKMKSNSKTKMGAEQRSTQSMERKKINI